MCGSALNRVERGRHGALRQDKAADDLARQPLRRGRQQEIVVDEREAMTIAADPAEPAAGGDDRLLESVRPEMQEEREALRHREAARPNSARRSRRSDRSRRLPNIPRSWERRRTQIPSEAGCRSGRFLIPRRSLRSRRQFRARALRRPAMPPRRGRAQIRRRQSPRPSKPQRRHEFRLQAQPVLRGRARRACPGGSGFARLGSPSLAPSAEAQAPSADRLPSAIKPCLQPAHKERHRPGNGEVDRADQHEDMQRQERTAT